MYSKAAYINFIKNNQATQFKSHLDAKVSSDNEIDGNWFNTNLSAWIIFDVDMIRAYYNTKSTI